MQKAAIAVLDVLGFKGIWRTKDPDQVLGALKTLVHNAEALARALQATRQSFTAQYVPVRDLVPWRLLTRAFSDTLIVACVKDHSWPADFPRRLATDMERLAEVVLISMVCEIVAYVTGAGGDLQPPFAYRGSIAFDDLAIDDQFLIGPAIDEAAEGERLALGAFVWLCPSAYRVIHEGFGEKAANDLPLVLDYLVPVKDSSEKKTHVINPFRRLAEQVRAEDVMANLLRSFDESRPDVAVKKRNTETFLRQARKMASA